uniref:Protein-tyrosine-phosphatase n=1 Tax=Arcella intermedia TaxID=1963864 RepID=A0A6B2LRQ2_9EUKA
MFLGSQDAATNEKGIAENDVKFILNVATGINYEKYPQITYKNVEIMDLPEVPIQDHFQEIFSFIDEALKTGGVLVHCNAGVSRSATIVIGYIMYSLKIEYTKAFQMVKTAKPDINPNEGFVRQLKNYQTTLL